MPRGKAAVGGKRKRQEESEEEQSEDESENENESVDNDDDDNNDGSDDDDSDNDDSDSNSDNDNDDDDDDDEEEEEEEEPPKKKGAASSSKAKPAPKKAAAKKKAPAKKAAAKKGKKDKAKSKSKSKSASKSSSSSSEPKVPKLKSTKKSDRLEEARKAYKWWEAPKLPNGINWRFLEHSGIAFAPKYVPHNIPLQYDGKDVVLTAEQEEMASFFAAMPLDGPQLGNTKTAPVFQRNFFDDFKSILGPGHVIKSFDKCNFDRIREHLQLQKNLKKVATDEEKLLKKEEKERSTLKFGYALIDGRVEKVNKLLI